jgi:hypothetical protein
MPLSPAGTDNEALRQIKDELQDSRWKANAALWVSSLTPVAAIAAVVVGIIALNQG